MAFWGVLSSGTSDSVCFFNMDIVVVVVDDKDRARLSRGLFSSTS